VNARIVRLFGFIAISFAVLVGFTSQWTVFGAEDLKQQSANKRPLFKAQQIKRGRITAADGTLIARSVGTGQGASRQYVREYPLGELFGHPVGYNFVEQGNSEFEQFHNDELTGEDSEFTTLFDELRGRKQVGRNVSTSLDPTAQQTAFDLLAGRPGAVVAIEPDTGRVRAMASQPPYDPNLIPEQLSELNADPGSSLVNRATQSPYPPGSTFKLVTATAALDSGNIDLDTLIDAPASLTVQGQPLANSGGSAFGEINVTTALTNSVNTFFAKLGRRVGEETLYEYMDRFGFNSKPDIDLPSTQLATSGVFGPDRRPLRADEGVDISRIAIGQERLLTTPLQMAEVAATIANDGDLMKPRIWDTVSDVDGRTVDTMEPSRQSEVMSEETASQLTEAMRAVVNEGTGTAAALSGIDVAGKTGTAEVMREECAGLPNQAWFVGFAPADDPQIAVAATVECTDGQGGTVAAPIAAGVMQTLIGG
jgi:peptidoglycan glycosyltransferase